MKWKKKNRFEPQNEYGPTNIKKERKKISEIEQNISQNCKKEAVSKQQQKWSKRESDKNEHKKPNTHI